LEVTFATRALRSLCEDPASADLPGDVVRELRVRLADLRAALSAEDLLVGVTLTAGPPPRIVLELVEDVVLRCVVAHRVVPQDAAGDVRWGLVRRVKVLAVDRGDDDG